MLTTILYIILAILILTTLCYSSRGPSTCGGSTGPFPELVAPGVNITITDWFGLYNTDSGTSFSAPHVAGALALLISANPNLSVADQQSALFNSAAWAPPARKMSLVPQMRAAKSDQERERIRNEHRELVQQRAKEKGVDVKGMAYGPGPGAGPGKGGASAKGR